jgi:hypothetical protein
MKSGAAPAWARALVRAVCLEAQVAPPAILRWRRLDRVAASGVTNRRLGSIAVSAGSDVADARHTLLHELAHWLAPDERTVTRSSRRRRRATIHHGLAFYRVAFPVYAAHEPPLEDALRREAGRYPSSLRHARALGIDSGALVTAEHRALLGTRSAARGRWRIMVPEHAVDLARVGRWYVCTTCGRRLVGRTLVRVARRGRRERHVLWTREPETATA